MNVWYLHGLESKAGGPKVDFLRKVSDKVFAPEIKYTNPNTFDVLLNLAKEDKPDLIIGSSMGGYYADAIASHFGINVLLFNPALHSRPIDTKLPYGDNFGRKFTVLGMEDKVIDYKVSLDLIRKDKAFNASTDSILLVPMGHRTPLNKFIDIYNENILSEIS